MLKHLVIALLAFIGDPTYLMRFWISVVLGGCLVAFVYWLVPGELPMWPGAVVLLLAAATGVAWEYLAANTMKGLK